MYIVFEGIIGSGKTTQTKQLGAFLAKKFKGKKVQVVREPGSTPIAEDIRRLAQQESWDTEEMLPLTNAYLFASARAQTLHTIVKPILEDGGIVISDRSFLSSLAIQGYAQGLGIETVASINAMAIHDVMPDCILSLDMPVEVALSRTFDDQNDKLEKMGKAFYQEVVRGYEIIARLPEFQKKWIHIDANADQETVEERVQKAVLDFFHI